MITIKEVAKLAGVSPTTASYALNNRPEVKEQTRKKVLQAAKELNYVPNKLAQSIRNGKTNTIMVLTSENIESGNTFSSEFLGVLAGAKSLNYDVLVKLVSTDALANEDIERLVGNSVCDGYLLLGNHLEAVAETLVKKEKKAVMVSSHSKTNIYTVNADGEKWIHNITSLALQKGKKHPAYVCFELRTEEEVLRYSGFKAALREAGIEEVPIFLAPEDTDIKGIVRQAVRNKIDAFICWNDVLAVRLTDELISLGYDIPGDIAITGFDDNRSYSNSVYRLTTVRQEFQEKGRTAIQKLIEQITKDEIQSGTCFVDCKIIERDTL